jgi:hypothetical protein
VNIATNFEGIKGRVCRRKGLRNVEINRNEYAEDDIAVMEVIMYKHDHLKISKFGHVGNH